MPTPYSSRHEGWKQEMNSALKGSKDSLPLKEKRNDFLDGFSRRQTTKRGCLPKPQTKPSKFYADSRLSRLKEQGYNSNDKKSSSKNDFVDGCLRHQNKTERHETEPSTYIEPNRRLRDQGCQLDNSNNKKCFSGKDFFDGFRQRSKPETDPCSTLEYSHLYEQELLANSSGRRDSKKPASVPSTQTKGNGSVDPLLTSSKSYVSPRRSLDDGGCLKIPCEQKYTIKSARDSIKTPSPTTRYLRTSTSSETCSQSSTTSQRNLHEHQRSRSSIDHSPKYTREPLTASIQIPSPSTRDINTSDSTSRLSSRFQGCPKVSEAEWKEIEKKSQHEQKEFLEQFLRDGKFEDVPVNSNTKNVRRGDHIFCKGMFGELYTHHLLCIHVDDGGFIHVIEYTGQFGSGAASQSIASSNPLALVAIKQGKITYEELEKKEAKIRMWPKELQRFSIDEVIARAESRLRKKERDYQLFNNNCEHFVTWCICGLNTSLQVKPWYQPVWDTTKGVGSAAIQGLQRHGVSRGVPVFLKAVGNFSDEILGELSSSLSPVGFAVGGAIETGFAAWNIYEDLKRMKEGRLSQDQFKINSVTTASKATFHIAGGIAGSVTGSVAGPLGSAVGGAVGYGVGHAVGVAVGFCYEHAPKIKKAFEDKVIAPVKKMVHACVKAVKTACQNIWDGMKDVFTSLFSWW